MLLSGAPCGRAAAESNAVGAVRASLAADGRSFAVRAPCLNGFRSAYSARVRIEGQERVFFSASGGTNAPLTRSTQMTPFGEAHLTTAIIRYGPADLHFRLGQVRDVAGVLLQTGIRNRGAVPIRVAALSAIDMTGASSTGVVESADWGLQLEGGHEEWLLTGLLGGPAGVTVPLTDFELPRIPECGALYRQDGAGFVFGPIGAPAAEIQAGFAHGFGGAIRFTLESAMTDVCVDPGELRWGQQVILLMEPPRAALARWAEWVARTHGARADRPALSGWNDRNLLKRRDARKQLADVAEAVRLSEGHLRPEVIQLESLSLQSIATPWARECARGVRGAAARLGLRVGRGEDPAAAPVAGPEEIRQSIRSAVEEGFTYLEVDCPPQTPPAEGEKRTGFEICRENWAEIRKAAGGGAYLACGGGGTPRAAVGSADACRAVAGGSAQGARAAMIDVLRACHLQGRWFSVDSGMYPIAAGTGSGRDLGWPLARTWISMVGLSCGAAITSDPWHEPDYRPYWRHVEVLTPPARERAEVLDLCTGRDWPRLAGRVRREWGDSLVALLWNPYDTEQPITLNFAAAGLDPTHHYAVWSFWDNRYLGVAQGSWTTPALGPAASQHLCFTDLERAKKPVVIGSNLHIYCGAAEIGRITGYRDLMEIELTDAGAREGDLFIYSRLPLVVREVTGCAFTGIFEAGENVWRVGLAQRRHDIPQRVELAIVLPAVRQVWFRVLVGLSVFSLLFGTWRYLAGQRLARENALAQERARIARDLHDDLGGGLTEIAMLSEVARQDRERPAEVETHLGRIFRSSREMTQALDEIVWAVNPANDTLDELVSYIGEFAREILEPASVRCRMDVPAELPALRLDSRVRHQLCMAMKECLHNVVKHARAGEVRIQFRLDDRLLEVSVEDDGVGFDPAAAAKLSSTHSGLGNLRQRMAEIGGGCEIHSAPGQGTRTRLRVRV